MHFTAYKCELVKSFQRIILGWKPRRETQLQSNEIWAGKGACEKETIHPGYLFKVTVPNQQGSCAELQHRTAPQQPPGSSQPPLYSVPVGTERNRNVVPAL